MYRARKREVQTKPGWKSLHRVKQEGGKKVGERDLGSVLEERPRERQRENGQLRERERGGKHRWRRHYILAGSSFGCQFLGCTRLRVYLYSTNDIFVTLSKPGRNWQSLWDREETACCSFFFKSRTLESKDNYCLLEISSSGSIFFLFFFLLLDLPTSFYFIHRRLFETLTSFKIFGAVPRLFLSVYKHQGVTHLEKRILKTLRRVYAWGDTSVKIIRKERWPLTRPTDTSSSTMLDTERKGNPGTDSLVRLFTALRLLQPSCWISGLLLPRRQQTPFPFF